MNRWRNYRFESSTGPTQEFSQFARDFKKHITNALPVRTELVKWSRGHFCISGFVKRGISFVYFSISDVRYFQDDWYNNILIRTAKHEKDYLGGSNNYTSLKGFADAVNTLL